MKKIVMTFGTFDAFHPGHRYYLEQAKKLGDYLIVVVARDSTVQSVKGRLPRYSQDQRRETIIDSQIADEVVIGDDRDHYVHIGRFRPDVLAFGYDQRSFNDERLESFLKASELSPDIVIIPPFEPERWKSSKMS